MTPRPFNADELVSAGHDGELGSAERAEFEQLLEGAPAARETLEDFRELSTLLQSMGRPRAPAQLLPTVRQAISALPARELTAAPRRRTWLWWSAPLLATAAALFLMVQAGGVLTVSREMAATGSAPRLPGVNDSGFAESADRALIREDLAAAPGLRVAATAPPATAAGVAPGDAFHSLSNEGAGTAAPNRMNLAATAAGELVFEFSRPPAVADVLAHVARVGDQTVIVDLEVVNIDRAAHDMLVLLRQRGVRVIDEAPGGSYGDAAGGGPLGAADQDALVAVYVEASDEQLAAVVNEVLAQVSVTEATARNVDEGASPLSSRLQQLTASPPDAAALPLRLTGTPDADRPQTGRTMVIPAAPRPASPQLPPSVASGQPASAATPAMESAGSPSNAPRAAREWGMKLPLPANLYHALEARASAHESTEVTSRSGQTQAKRAMGQQQRLAADASAGPPAPEAVPGAEAAAQLANEPESAAAAESMRRVLFVIQAAPQN